MQIMIMKNYEEISKVASNIVAEIVKDNPKAVLGLATGSTPIGTYKELIKMYKEGKLDFSEITSFNLDEYVSLDGSHPSSYRYFMDNELFNHINIKKENAHVPDGKAENINQFCKDYDKKIEEAGGIDLQILGIGSNGHIAFIEPEKELPLETHIAELTESTINDNQRFFHSIDEVPRTAISMGIGSIMKAKKIILLANGKNKEDAIKKILIDRKVTTEVPGSILLLHPDVTFIVDEEAYGRNHG